ncbi:MAG: CCA tRNA nucleotidyltransferase [Hyphomicrobiales bacterium]|nr:CCA tRNA nucleotidyltransferase [Hyphomicrobiales bacterium]
MKVSGKSGLDVETCRLDPRWLGDGPIRRLLAVLDCDGEEARVVGGAVRNALIGVPPGDIDVATTALPQEVIRRVEAAGLKAVPTGLAHGTITVVADGEPYEITTLREDVETFGRHATVSFGRNWRRDAERRDFTMNGLSVSRDGTVYDYVGGLTDIAQRRVRFIGDAGTRIAEDYLRILRFFRFHAVYGEGPPDLAGLHACIAGRAGLAQLSRERIRMELMKLLLGKHAVPMLAAMSEAGLVEQVLGGVPYLASCANMMKLETALALAPDPVRRLGALAVWVTEDAERLRQRLRLANAEGERLLSMADGWWRLSRSTGERAGRVLLYQLGPGQYLDRLLVAWTRAPESASDEAWHALASLPSRWSAPRSPFKSGAFTTRGVPRGPRLGQAMRAAEAAWIAADFPRDPTAIAAITETAAQATRE